MMPCNPKRPSNLGLPVLAPLADICRTESGRFSINLREEQRVVKQRRGGNRNEVQGQFEETDPKIKH